MRLLFIHEAFPAQFGRLALELTERYGWHCTCLFQHLSRCPTPSAAMLQRLALIQLPPDSDPEPPGGRPWAQRYGHALTVGRDVYEAVRTHHELRPDLVVGHGGLTPTLFLRDHLTCPIVDYCEYYFAVHGRDLTYRVDLPPVEPTPFFPRCINAATLVNLVASDAGYTASDWQRCSFPERFRDKIEVHFDGIDTQLYCPSLGPRRVAGQNLPPGTRVVTFVARGLESMRGFDLFMQVAQRIHAERADVLFVVVGSEETYYGWDRLFTTKSTFREWVFNQGKYNVNRFLFLGHLEPAELADVLCLSDLHVYLSVPFVVSWSLFNALACGCTVLASDTAPVREVIEPGRTGLLEPLFDLERMAGTALRVLKDPEAYRSLGEAARALMQEKYSLDVAVPQFKGYFERVAASGRTASLSEL
jgi:glycosyltransferase involved in cell wall biosynthesis